MKGLVRKTSLTCIATVVMVTVLSVVMVTATTPDGDSALRHVYANYSGDLLLAGFFPIHQHSDAAELHNCGRVQEQDGIQALEMFLFTLDEINKSGFLPNFTLGAVALDSCDDEMYALQQGVDLVAVLTSKVGYNQNSYICSDGTKPDISPSAKDLHKVFSVVGGSSSSVTLNLASFFTLFSIPQISYLATTTDLSNREMYPHFKRTVPSDSVQAKAIMTLLKSFNWTYVSVIYEDTNYGLKGFTELERAALEEGVCFASKNLLETNHWSDIDYDNVMQELLDKDKAKVVVLYVDWPQARKVFEAAERNGIKDNFTWVGSDAWSGRTTVVTGHEEVVNGAITLQPHAFIDKDFDTYFKGLNLDNNERNPWFDEFWESHFKCDLPEVSGKVVDCDATECKDPRYVEVMLLQETYQRRICTRHEVIGEGNSEYYQQNYLHFISDAVLAYAHALRNIHADICGPNFVGLCPGMNPTNLTGDMITSYLDNLTFTASNGVPFQFYNGMDGPPIYTIMHYGYDSITKIGAWRPVGNYSGVSGRHLLFLEDDFAFHSLNETTSVCSLPCEKDQARQVIQPLSLCCWVCTQCSEDEIVTVSPLYVSETCLACEAGTYPSEDRRTCSAITVTFLSYNHGGAIGAMLFATIGIVATAFTFMVFIVYGNTPVVKASGRELSFYLLTAIFFSFSSTFIIVHRPTRVVCGASRVLTGLCFTMIYASILTKTNRISRIFNGGNQKGKRARYTSPKSQIIIVNILVFVEVLIIISWLIAAPPGVDHAYPHRLANVLVCAGEQGAIYLLGLIYPAILLFCCTIYAFWTRKTPDGFNETKHVGIVSYTTVVILIALIPIFFLTDEPGVKTLAICFTLSLTASVVLCCIFVPKLYICLFRPNKNTKEAIMQRTTSVLSSVSVNSLRDRAPSCGFCGKDNLTMNNTNDYIAGVLTPQKFDDNQLRERGLPNNNSKDNFQNDRYSERRQSVEDGLETTQNDRDDKHNNSQDDDNDEGGSINTETASEISQIGSQNGSQNGVKPGRDTLRLREDERSNKRSSISSVTFANDVDIISDDPNGTGSRRSTISDRQKTSTPIPKDEDINDKDDRKIDIKPVKPNRNNKKNLILQKALDNLVLEDSGIADEQDITTSDNENNEQNQESVT